MAPTGRNSSGPAMPVPGRPARGVLPPSAGDSPFVGFADTQMQPSAPPEPRPTLAAGGPGALAAAARPGRWWRRLGVLQWALALSVGVHAGLLTMRFVDPERFERVFRDTPLEVILVNARGQEPPTQAQAIAQAALAGGGDAAAGRATSPLPAAAQVELGDASDEAHRRIEQLQQMQQQLLASVHQELAKLPPPDPQRDEGTPQAREQEERRRQLLKQMAEIEKRITEENARPRKRFISPATREAVYALYYDRLRRRVEERGTRDFPTHQGRKLYGELTMNITVDVEGRVVDAEVMHSSGNKALDRRALAIVQGAAPYGRFNGEMRNQADQIVVSSRFRFTRDEGLETSLSAPQMR
ncbi:energy transducer TonB [Aquabacterium sp. OR-4]|uniref:energy transducer TonB n=1 Tax=Aquabacterium sp. OR-4 TaxID=2978127 RepID=UPI0021B262BB|nr:TonB family protein [Aquabacterium sp. OR-4]MDT7834398.1 TonB family protein [Aquabacterium sp. OR-4]